MASHRSAFNSQDARLDFPTAEQVEAASHEQLGFWYRFLAAGSTPEQRKIFDRIAERFEELGGMTPALSRKLGHGGISP